MPVIEKPLIQVLRVQKNQERNVMSSHMSQACMLDQLSTSDVFSSLSGVGVFLLSQHCFKVSLRSAFLSVDQSGAGAPNSPALPEEADGHRGPLLVPKLHFLVEFRQRREVLSGSLGGHRNHHVD